MATDPRIPSTALTAEEAKPIEEFISVSPNSIITLKETKEGGVALGRLGASGISEDVVLALDMKKVFSKMQNSGFLCQLPADPAETHMGQSGVSSRSSLAVHSRTAREQN